MNLALGLNSGIQSWINIFLLMENYTEYIGYGASLLVLTSFIMRKMLYLRVINISGCSLFIWYGALLDSMPIILTNVAIVLVNVFYILKIISKKKQELSE